MSRWVLRAAVGLVAAVVVLCSSLTAAQAAVRESWSLDLRVPLCRLVPDEGTGKWHAVVGFVLRGEGLRPGGAVGGLGSVRQDDAVTGDLFDVELVEADERGGYELNQAVTVGPLPELLPGAVTVDLAVVFLAGDGDVAASNMEQAAACTRPEPVPGRSAG